MAMLREICQGHLEAGMRVTLVHGRRPETSDSALASLKDLGVDVVSLEGWGKRRPASEFRAIAKIRRLVRSLDPDLIVAHSSFAGSAGMLAARSRASIFVPHAFQSEIAKSGIRRYTIVAAERLVCRVFSVTACVSHSEARVAKARGASNVQVVLNGSPLLDDPSWSESPALPPKPTVVGCGRLVPQRRPLETARILLSVSGAPRLRWVGGAGEDATDYARSAEREFASSGIDVTGWMGPTDVAVALQEATAYVHWTAWDGLPLTVLEAMAADAVVVAADTEPNREVVGPRGVFADEEAAAAELVRLISDESYWRNRALEQRELARPYSASRMRSEWNELVMTVCRHGPTQHRFPGSGSTGT
jgi:glycosyltransferase involved in cell wall biosynthesis